MDPVQRVRPRIGFILVIFWVWRDLINRVVSNAKIARVILLL
jgi:hypothetical protein